MHDPVTGARRPPVIHRYISLSYLAPAAEPAALHAFGLDRPTNRGWRAVGLDRRDKTMRRAILRWRAVACPEP